MNLIIPLAVKTTKVSNSGEIIMIDYNSESVIIDQILAKLINLAYIFT